MQFVWGCFWTWLKIPRESASGWISDLPSGNIPAAVYKKAEGGTVQPDSATFQTVLKIAASTRKFVQDPEIIYPRFRSQAS